MSYGRHFWVVTAWTSRRAFLGHLRDGKEQPWLLPGILAVALAFGGCQSMSPSQYVSPRVEGRVVDAQTHQPVQGVNVRWVAPGQDPDADEAPRGGQAMEQTPQVRTGRDGAFALASERDLELFRRWSWYSVTLSFEHAGYVSFRTNYTPANATTTPKGEPLVKTGDVHLMPLPR
jgi:hypothetical protein